MPYCTELNGLGLTPEETAKIMGDLLAPAGAKPAPSPAVAVSKLPPAATAPPPQKPLVKAEPPKPAAAPSKVKDTAPPLVGSSKAAITVAPAPAPKSNLPLIAGGVLAVGALAFFLTRKG